MPKIEISFSELLNITTALELWAQDVQSIDRREWHRIMSLCSELHRRFAETATPDDYQEATPEDFKEVP